MAEEKKKADMSEAARRAWATRRQKYGEKGLSQKPIEEQKVEQPKKAKKSSKMEQPKKPGEASESEQPAETQSN